jgi:hypothetical protein
MAESTIYGRWDLVVHDTDESFPSWVEITPNGGQFVGKVGSARPLAAAQVDGDRVTFTLPRQYESRTTDLSFEGTLTDGRLEGTCLSDKGEQIRWVGNPAPALSFDREPQWGEPIELVAGSREGWTVRWPEMADNWTIVDGALDNKAVGTDLVTEQKFSDFRLIAEYRYPKGSNSGIYLRGRYEFQILDDYGSDPHVGGSGAIYGFLAPTANAVKQADEWQTADITLLGRRITVVLNGQTVVENQEIPGITGGALDSQEGEPGPLFVQGDHGPVTFRRLTLIPVS